MVHLLRDVPAVGAAVPTMLNVIQRLPVAVRSDLAHEAGRVDCATSSELVGRDGHAVLVLTSVQAGDVLVCGEVDGDELGEVVTARSAVELVRWRGDVAERWHVAVEQRR